MSFRSSPYMEGKNLSIKPILQGFGSPEENELKDRGSDWMRTNGQGQTI